MEFLLAEKYWYFSYFSIKTYVVGTHKEIICMKCQSLFSGKNKKNIINLSSPEFANRVKMVAINTLPAG